MSSIKVYKNNYSIKYYSVKNIRKYKGNINLIFSGRSDGKTFSSLSEIALEGYVKSHHKNNFIYCRRMREDFTRGRGGATFQGVNQANKVYEITKGKWEKVIYRNSSFYLAKYDEELDKDILDSQPCGFAIPLSEAYHAKSSNYDSVKDVILDEFISPDNIGYLVDEWSIWQNLQSTIIRGRDDVTFWLFGNSIDIIDNPYFREMNLTEIVEQMEIGDIVVIDTDSGLRICIERALVKEKSKLSDKFFNFSGSTGEKMITDGEWSYTEYPHLPPSFKYENTQRVTSLYLDYHNKLITIELLLVYDDKGNPLDFIAYLHNKTTPLKYNEGDIILTDKTDTVQYNVVNDLKSSSLKVCKKLLELYNKGKVYYQDNKIGSLFNSYLG